ncbi:MAG TPA: ester cyclase [Agromyces sp.]|nr:ester cyclase [Agromyces sp.]
MSLATNREIARRFIEEVWNNGDLALAEDLLARGLVNHDPDGHTTDYDGFLKFIGTTREALPDIRFTIDDMIAEEDKVATRVTIHATQRATDGAAAAEQPVAWSGIGIVRVDDGRIVEQWADTDSIGTAIGALNPELG